MAIGSIPTFYPKWINFPTVVQAITERVLIYIAQVLYEAKTDQEIRETIYNRILLSDIDSGNDTILGDASQFFKTVGGRFPFTAYGIGDREIRTESSNTFAQRGMIYIDGVGYILANPAKLFLPMVSFFNRAEDWNIAFTKLISENGALTRLRVPVKFWTTDWSFSIDVGFNPLTKGSFAGSFEEYLRTNNIWDIQHTVEVSYYEYAIFGSKEQALASGVSPINILEGSFLQGKDTPLIYPVDDMIVSLVNLYVKNPTTGTLVESIEIAPNPQVILTNPVNKTLNNPVNLSEISIQFDHPMLPSTVEDSFSIIPYVEGIKGWVDLQKTTFKYTITQPLHPNTRYLVTLGKSSKSGAGQTLIRDYTFEFTTGVI